MAVSVTHTFVSPVADGGDPDIVGPNEWNAAHSIAGLGTAAEADTTDFATAAQGAKADTAVQPADIANMLETGDIGVSVQAYDADLTAWAGVNPSSYSTTAQIAAAYQPLDADLTAWAAVNPSSYSTTAQIAAAYQPLDSDLTTIAGLTRTRGDLIRGGASAWERYALGTAGYALKSDGTDIVYAPTREVLTADRTYYVRTDGSNSNTGLVDSAGGAFLTIQKAIDVVAALDIGVFNVAIQVADGTYTGTVVVTGPWVGSGTVTLQGNSGTPANVLLSMTSAIAITVQTCGRLTVKDMKIQTTGGGTFCLNATTNGALNFTNIVFGACGNAQIRAADTGVVTADGNYSISAGAVFHWRASLTGVMRCSNRTITITGTPAFSVAFASVADVGVMLVNGNTYSGSATGKRYDATNNGVIDTVGAGATALPGDVSGTIGTGGQYV